MSLGTVISIFLSAALVFKIMAVVQTLVPATSHLLGETFFSAEGRTTAVGFGQGRKRSHYFSTLRKENGQFIFFLINSSQTDSATAHKIASSKGTRGSFS